jgi:hypothetical protein
MLKEFFRIFRQDATLTDLSLNNFDDNQTIDINAGETCYILQRFTFNHLFFEVSSANTAESTMKVEYHDGTAWREAVDYLDSTMSGLCTLGKTGVFQFQRRQDYGWNRITDTSKTSIPTELNELHLYNMYAMRLIFSGAVKCKIKTIQYAFCTSDDLACYDVEINSYLSSFQTGKTNWNKEIMTASKLMVMDLKTRGIIDNKGQILTFDDFVSACAYKTLYLIYSNLGKGYEEKKKQASDEYNSLLSIKRFTIDENQDGFLDTRELQGFVRTMVR